jgi:flavin reductase (DIM6/NTAB) family NADH-FMN oxidoreductase RutF
VNKINTAALFKLSYGLFVLSSISNNKDNACIVNTVSQVTDNPLRVSVAVNKQNLTHDFISESGVFCASVLDSRVDFETFKRFGFQSGKTADKLLGLEVKRTASGFFYADSVSNAFIEGTVEKTLDLGTHTMFIGAVTDAEILSQKPSVTYADYHAKIKPQPQKANNKGWRCKICGYVYEGEELPDDFVCPICKHGAADFEKL